MWSNQPSTVPIWNDHQSAMARQRRWRRVSLMATEYRIRAQMGPNVLSTILRTRRGMVVYFCEHERAEDLCR